MTPTPHGDISVESERGREAGRLTKKMFRTKQLLVTTHTVREEEGDKGAVRRHT